MGRKPVADDETGFSARSACRIGGLSRTQLQRFVDEGLVRPQGAGGGRGSITRYPLGAVIALVAGQHYAALGFDPGWCRALIKLIRDTGHEGLTRAIHEGRTWACPGSWVTRNGRTVHLPGALIPPPAPDAIAKAEAELACELDIGRVLARLQHRLAEDRERTAANKTTPKKRATAKT
jgi:hypothetical protein